MPAVVEQHRIAFFNVPKVASSSVKHALYEIENGKPFRREENQGHIHTLYKVKLPVTEETYREFDGYWKFTVVRDPVRRLLSAYTNRVLHHRDLTKIRRARWRALRHGLSLTPGIDSFIRKLERYRAFSRSIRHHTDPLDIFLGPDLSHLDAIYRIEDLTDLAADLTARTGMHVEISHEQQGGPKLDIEMLSKPTFDKVIDLTAREYEMLGGLYEPPAP